jgi:hypothetical protein
MISLKLQDAFHLSVQRIGLVQDKETWIAVVVAVIDLRVP